MYNTEYTALTFYWTGIRCCSLEHTDTVLAQGKNQSQIDTLTLSDIYSPGPGQQQISDRHSHTLIQTESWPRAATILRKTLSHSRIDKVPCPGQQPILGRHSHTDSALRPIQSSSCDVQVFLCLCLCLSKLINC